MFHSSRNARIIFWQGTAKKEIKKTSICKNLQKQENYITFLFLLFILSYLCSLYKIIPWINSLERFLGSKIHLILNCQAATIKRQSTLFRSQIAVGRGQFQKIDAWWKKKKKETTTKRRRGPRGKSMKFLEGLKGVRRGGKRKRRNGRHGEEQKEEGKKKGGGREKKKRSGKQGEKRDRERGSRGRQWSTVTTNYTIVGRFTMEQLRAAGWADGMSFSPFAGEKTILVPILSPHDTLIPLFPSLSLPLCPDLFLRLEASHSGLRAVCRLHKVIILRSPRGYRVRGEGEVRTHLETHFEWTAREAEINSFPARLAGRPPWRIWRISGTRTFRRATDGVEMPETGEKGLGVGVYEFILKGIPATINVGSSNNLSAGWLFAPSRLGI